MAYTSFVKVVWDRGKDVANQKKHGVSFREASELLTSGVDYLEIFDEPTRMTRTVSFPSARSVAAWFSLSGRSAMTTTSGSSVPVGPRGASRCYSARM